jgi:hypothetical protein
MMKKAFLALLIFLLSGCLAATPPMGANKEAGGNLEKDAPTDAFAPVPVPVVAEPAAATPPPVGPTPVARMLPGDGGGDTGDGRTIASAAPAPIDPKTDQAQAEPLPCTVYRLRTAPDFSTALECGLLILPHLPGTEPTTFSHKLRLIKNVASGDLAYDWTTEADSVQVRLVYVPDGKKIEEGSFVDALTATAAYSPTENYNVDFDGVPDEPGSFYFYARSIPGRTADYNPGSLKTFDASTYGTTFSQSGGSDFIPAGQIKLVSKADVMHGVMVGDDKSKILHAIPEPDKTLSKSLERDLSRPSLKDIYQSAP